MKEKNLFQLIEIAKKEVILYGYSKTSISKYNEICDELVGYYKKRNINIFSYEICLNYFKERFHLNYIDFNNISKYKQTYLRLFKILESLNKNENIKHHYYYTEKEKLNISYNGLIENFSNYIEMIGLSNNIIDGMIRINKRFLLYLDDINIKTINSINYNDLLPFINTFPQNRKSKNLYLYYLRTFLNYLYEKNNINQNLSIYIPNLKIVKNNSIPSIWNFEEIKLLLNSIDRTCAKGKRTYAVILLALTTSMRGCDIINLKITDIDFKNNIIRFIQEKTKVALELPLLESTKEAIIDYLLNARPKSNYDNVFLNLLTIAKPLESVRPLTKMVKQYSKFLNLDFNQKRGIHSFRHTVLNQLFNDNETSLTTISNISGHCKEESLHSYIKTDVDRLRNFTLNIIDFGGSNEEK